MTDLDAIRARHVPAQPFLGDALVCEVCRQEWGTNGCDTAVTLAALDEKEMELGARYALIRNYMKGIASLRRENDAAIEREARLRAALDALECPAAKHHRVTSIRKGSRITAWPEDGPVLEPDTLTSDRCTACGFDFLATIATTPEGE